MNKQQARTFHLHWFLDPEQRKGAYGPIISFLESGEISEGSRILEVGCGPGSLLPYFKQISHKVGSVIGLDPDLQALQHARTEPVVCGSAFDLPFRDQSVDYILLVSVLHHLVGRSMAECRRNWMQVFKECSRVCRKGGYVMFREDPGVRTRLFQQLVFGITSNLDRRKIEVKRLAVESGLVLAFLTSNDMLGLCETTSGLDIVQYSVDDRPAGNRLSGLLRSIWQWQTCSFTAILQRR